MNKKESIIFTSLFVVVILMIIVFGLYSNHMNSINPETIDVEPMGFYTEEQILKEEILIDVNTTHIYCDTEISVKSMLSSYVMDLYGNREFTLLKDMLGLLNDIDSQISLIEETNTQDIIVPKDAMEVSIKKSDYSMDMEILSSIFEDSIWELRNLFSYLPDELSIYMWKEEYRFYSGVHFSGYKYVVVYNEYYVYGESMRCKDAENTLVLFGTHN